MKKFMKLIPAFVMLLVSAILVSTATYAWFSMNTTVTATGMSVKAVAEDGLLINYVKTVGDSGWSNSANTHSSLITLSPSSTKDLSDWYHNHSTSASDADAYLTTTWTALSITPSTTAAVAATNGERTLGTFADSVGGSTLNAYVKYVYYIKSSANAITVGGDVYKELDIDKITISGQSADGILLCKALRIGIVCNGQTKIVAPFAGATASYPVGGTTPDFDVLAVGTLAVGTTEWTVNQDLLTSGTIPAVSNANPLEVDIYIWFEGEDANCISDNTNVLNELSVSVSFNLETNAD